MGSPTDMYENAERVRRYVTDGPPAFTPGHAGLLQMIGVLLAERVPQEGNLLIVGAGGGLETRYLAGALPRCRFVGVDPARPMLDMARTVAGPAAGDRLTLIEGTVLDAPPGPFDAATCILVLHVIPDDGTKARTLENVHRRLKPGAPFVLVDQCIDRSAPDFEDRVERYGAYALASGVDARTVSGAKEHLRANQCMVPPNRNEQLLRDAGFKQAEVFYVGMAWRGWIARA
jgi:tRNA (cmo5U34)-methyltransferase